MKEDKIFVNQEQLQRWQLIELVRAGQITLKEAAAKMGVSYRQAKRLKHAVEAEGLEALRHGNCGRRAWNRTNPELCQQVLDLSKNIYKGFNDTHFAEILGGREAIDLSRETIRKLRRQAGIAPKQQRKAKKHYKRRARKAQEGMMLLWDGSPHAWFGLAHPSCCLLAAIDDATSRVVAARFFPFEGSVGYFWLLRQVVDQFGIPLSIYQDRHAALRRNDDNWSLEEQLAGRQEPTQVGLALEMLGIKPIFALSPQAKGRVERLFGTLQDRLVAELTLNKVSGIEEANEFLATSFIEGFNRRFAVSPRETEKAWRPVAKEIDVERIISFRYLATVSNDNAVRLGGVIIDIPPGPRGRSYARTRVEVRQLLDGSWRVYASDRLIARHLSTTLTEPVRALQRKRRGKGGRSYALVYTNE
ncbi:MAG: ISNCY family transposase [Acidobacteria bacterium]|nr:ISNCY family transposase [Acidobacteriota bacterium]